MGRPANKLVGNKYGALTVESRAGSDKLGQALWWVRCKCGTRYVKRGLSLHQGLQSCGFKCPYSPVRHNGRKKGQPRRTERNKEECNERKKTENL